MFIADIQGDPMRALQARRLISLIQSHSLVDHTAKIGLLLQSALQSIFNDHPQTIQNFRGHGKGTFLSWDFTSGAERDKFLGIMKGKGVLMGGCGEKTVRLRPMLTFGEGHVEVLTQKIRESLAEM